MYPISSDSLLQRFTGKALAACKAMTCMLVFATTANAQLAAKIVAANGAGSDIYSVEFVDSSGTTTILNTDSNLHTGIRSLVFRPNLGTAKIDLIAADTSRGEILLYRDGIGNSELIWGPGSGLGPVQPDGMSLDGNGNLYVVSPGPTSKSPPEVWVFPRSANLVGFDSPRLVDNSFPVGSTLVETVSVRETSAIAAAGSLLVLSSKPNQVLAYSATNLQSVLNGNGQTNANSPALVPSGRFPSGSVPGGMDIWPLTGHLLVTSYDRVLRFSATARLLPDFANNLGNGKQNKFKIRAARVDTSAIAVLADNANGKLLKYIDAGNGIGNLNAVVTSGVNRPQALATTNAATIDVSCYTDPDGCNALGEQVLSHKALNIDPIPTGTSLLQELCIVSTDPRWNAATNSWNNVSLPINSVCPGFGSSVIPAFLRGGSGASGKGFAIVSSESGLVLPSGAVVESKIFTENLLDSKPVCTAPFSAEIVTWAPTDGEGSIVETYGQLDVTTGCENPLLAGTRGGSDWVSGLVLNTDALTGSNTAKKLHGFTESKYVNLRSTVVLAVINAPVKTALLSCLDTSKAYFDTSKYSKALTQLRICAAQVEAAWTLDNNNFVPSAANPNPYGEIVTRIENLDYTLRYRQSAVIVPL